MPIGLRAAALPGNLQSTYATPEENALAYQDAEQTQLAGMNTLQRAVGRGLYQMPAGLADAGAQILEPFAPQKAQPIFDWAGQQREVAKRMHAATDIQNYDNVHSAGDLANYVANMAGENLPNMLPAMAGGVLGRIGLRNAALSPFAKTAIGGTVAAFPQQMGEGVGALREDPTIMANTTPMQRLGASALYGAATAPLEALPDELLANRLMGGGEKLAKNIFKDGLKKTAVDAAKHVGVGIGESALTEGVPEALEQKAQQVMQIHYNPNRDTSRDEHDIKDSFFGGWAAGAGSSMAGRGADVGFAQARGAKEALRNLLSPKVLPDNLKNSDDQSVIGWDNEDNQKRNTWASDLADKIMNSDASQSMKDAAKSFYDKAGQGISDAWTSLSEPLRENEYVQRSKDGLDRFLGAAKKTYGDLTQKHNAEGSEDDKVMYGDFRQHLDPRGSAARNASESSELYGTVKEALLTNTWHELPWHELEDQFGTVGKATAAVMQMRDNLLRTEHADKLQGSSEEFKKLFEGAVADGQAGSKARADIVKQNATLAHRNMTDSDARDVSRGISDFLTNSKPSEKHKAAFDAAMKEHFGTNAGKVIAAHAPRRIADNESVSEHNDEGQTNPAFQTIHETDGPATSFIGSSKGTGEHSVGGHGGMWNIGHGKAPVRAEIRSRMAQTVAKLRKAGNDVKLLSPLEYSVAAGISPGKVAQNLGTSVEKLADHPARMIMSTPKGHIGLREDAADLSTDAIKDISARTVNSQRHISSKVLDEETAPKVISALAQKGASQRRAMSRIGLEHGVRTEQLPDGRIKLHNNLDHGGNGNFTVTMSDGTKQPMASQHLIAHMRKNGMKGSPLQLFNAGVAALMANKDVANVSVKDVWGREHKDKKDGLGVFGEHFQIMPGMSLGHANRKSQSSNHVADSVDAARDNVELLEEAVQEAKDKGLSEEKIDTLENELEDAKEELAAAEQKQSEYEGEGDRKAVVEGSPKQGVRTHQEETGEGLHPHGREVRGEGGGGKTTDLKGFKGLKLKLRPGVSTKHFVGEARKTLAGLQSAKELFDASRLPTSTLDVSADYLARSAAAQRDGDQKARNAYVLLAQHRLYSALNDEMRLIEAAAENASEADKAPMRETYGKLLKEAAKWYDKAQEYEANRDKVQAAAQGYETFEKTGKPAVDAEKEGFKPAADRFEHRGEFMATLENKTDAELIADGKARRERYESMKGIPFDLRTEKVQQLIDMMKAELEMGREELKRRKAPAEDAQAEETTKEEAPPEELKTEAASHEDEFEKALSDVEKLAGNIKGVSDALRKAFANLKDAYTTGDFNRAELVANLRAAAANLRAAIGDGARIVTQAVQRFIKGYQQASRNLYNTTKAKVESSLKEAHSPTFSPISQADPITPAALNELNSHLSSAEYGEIKAPPFSIYGDALNVYNELVVKGLSRDKLVAAMRGALAHDERMVEKLDNMTAKQIETFGVKLYSFDPAIVSPKDNGAVVPGFTNTYFQAFTNSVKEGGMGLRKLTDAEARILSTFAKHLPINIDLSKFDAILVKDVSGTAGVINKSLGFYSKDANTLMISASELKPVFDVKVQGGNLERMLRTLAHEYTHVIDRSSTGTLTSENPHLKVSSFLGTTKGNGDVAKEFLAMQDKYPKHEVYFYPSDKTWTKKAIGKNDFFAAEIAAQLLGYYAVKPDVLKSESELLYNFGKELFDAANSKDAREIERVFAGRNADADNGLGGKDGGLHSSKASTGSEQHNHEGSFANGTTLTQADMDGVKSYIEKTLGNNVAVAFDKAMNIGGSASWTRDPATQQALVKVAVNATNPLSKAHHEAMHELFQRLMDNHPEAAKVLGQAADAPAVRRQIEQFFHNEPNYAKIKAAIANDQHERVAYMFQLWAAGKLNVGPQTQTWFQKVVKFLKNALGIVSNSERAEAIMSHFHDGKMAEPNDMARVLEKDMAARDAYLKKASEWLSPVYSKARELLITAQNELIDSDNKSLEKIGRMFSNETGAHDKDISLLSARAQKTNQMIDRLYSIFNEKDQSGNKMYDQKDIDAALKGLQAGVTSNDPAIARMQGRIHKMLDQIHTYMKDAGVDLGKVQDYFPRAWDSIAIAENRDKFKEMLKNDHAAAGLGQMSDTTADAIAAKIITDHGAEPLTESEYRVGYTPYMPNANKRALNFLKHPDFAKFQKNDMADILTTYIAGAVHRAEYTRRFGNNGSGLRKMLKEAVGEAVGAGWATAEAAADKKYKDLQDSLKKQHGKDYDAIAKELDKAGYSQGEVEIKHIVSELTPADASKYNDFEPQLNRARRSIMAMEGTLGADINPNIRRWTSGLIVYENMRMLWMSLFSQVIDPLGVMVRGGTVSDAWNTFTKGIQGTINGWKGTAAEDSATKLAMQLGIIDASNFLNSQGNTYSSVFMGKTAKHMNDRLFRMNGVEGFSQGTRVGAMEAAIKFIAFHGGKGDQHSERYLAELGLTKADVKLASDGSIDTTDKKIQDAIFRWVDGAVLRPNASMRPSWSSDPHYALVFHMKQFTYAAHKVLLERVLNESKEGNLDPAITMALTYVPAMIASDFLRGVLSNGGAEPPWKRKWKAGDYLWDGVQRAGLLGIPQLGLDAAKWGPTELGGPVVQQAAHSVHTMEKSFAKDHALDVKAAQTHLSRDKKAADDYDGFTKGAKRVVRDALPMGELSKKLMYDELVN